MALIRVPEWAMPIQKTKQVMYRAHITGQARPLTPMPMYICRPQAQAPRMVHRLETPSPRVKRRLGGRSTGRMSTRETSASEKRAGPISESWGIRVRRSRFAGHSSRFTVHGSQRAGGPGRAGVEVELGAFEIGHGGVGVLLGQQAVGARVLGEAGDAAGRVEQIAEDDGVGGAGLLAGGLDVAVAHGGVVGAGIELDLGDALHAEGALLHDAFGAHGDLRVQLLVEGLG